MTLRRDGTDNLLDLYREYAGTSEVPPQYHLWCALSMLAAAVSNRVWLEKMPGRRLTPNLYVALIGPSAIGKNEAIDTMLDVTRDQPRVNIYKGKITAPAMLDLLAMPARPPGKTPWSHLYLVTPELAWSMGKGDWADLLVKQLTELYGGSVDALREITRTHGGTKIDATELCINWIAGTTASWLHQTIHPDNISGGFFGRIVTVPADYDFETRYWRPTAAPERGDLRAMLRARLSSLSRVSGLFTQDPAAVYVERKWYEERPAPTDPDLQAAWKRQHDFMLKLAMLMSLAESEDLRITAPMVAAAQRLSDGIVRRMAKVIGVQAMSVETRGQVLAMNYLKRFSGPVPHSNLLKYMSGRGYDAMGTRRVMETLREMGHVSFEGWGKGRAYLWLALAQKYIPEPLPPQGGNGDAELAGRDDEASEPLDDSE